MHALSFQRSETASDEALQMLMTGFLATSNPAALLNLPGVSSLLSGPLGKDLATSPIVANLLGKSPRELQEEQRLHEEREAAKRQSQEQEGRQPANEISNPSNAPQGGAHASAAGNGMTNEELWAKIDARMQRMESLFMEELRKRDEVIAQLIARLPPPPSSSVPSL
jgi:hypothetical protein